MFNPFSSVVWLLVSSAFQASGLAAFSLLVLQLSLPDSVSQTPYRERLIIMFYLENALHSYENKLVRVKAWREISVGLKSGL